MDFQALFDRVNAAAAAPGGAPEAPRGYNGTIGVVNMAKPIDYTSDRGKIILNPDTNQYDMRLNLAYQLWLVQGKPEVAREPTAAEMEMFWPRFGRIVCRSRYYSVMHASAVLIQFRHSDVIPVPAVAREGLEFVDALYSVVSENEALEAHIAGEGQNVLFSFVANGLHRKQNDGHSFFTDNIAEGKTNNNTFRTLSVAGASKATFKIYMREAGHDDNHHLTDESLHSICFGLTTANPVLITDVLGDLTYMGHNIVGESLQAVFPVGEAAADRYPPGVLGKASLIVGLQMMLAMINHISNRALVTGADPIVSRTKRVLSNLQAQAGNRTSFQSLDQRLGETLATCYGYCVLAKLVEEEQYMAFASHAGRYPGAVATGKALAQTLLSAKPHEQAVAGSVTTALASIATALDSVREVVIDARHGPYNDGPVIDQSKLSAKVGEDSLAALLKSRAGDTFFDT